MQEYVHYGNDANLCLGTFFRMSYVHMLHYEGFVLESLLAQGTAANARDVASMVDAIDGAGSEINYWYSLGPLYIASFMSNFITTGDSRMVKSGHLFGFFKAEAGNLHKDPYLVNTSPPYFLIA